VDIGGRLKIARKSVGYTLAIASQKSGIGESSLSEFESGKREPRFSQLSRLSEVYQKTIEFFLTESTPAESVMLWREKPESEADSKEVEAHFRRLCEQYNRLELSTGEMRRRTFPSPDVKDADRFEYSDAREFARKVHKEFSLGEIPGAAIKQVLEESYFVKLFYLDFDGSAISTVSGEFGPAILLNRKNKLWRRNYDLAHELFHILTWTVFRSGQREDNLPSLKEEKLANAFASTLLMPEESLRSRIESRAKNDKFIELDQLDDIAREFGVSLAALIYRIASIYRFKKEDTERYVAACDKYLSRIKPRESDAPATLPERYCDLAQRALREGKLSLIQFAKYVGISYRKAQEYLIDDEDITDEKISIPVA
jgi:Zn-dependent peptidase ImmA (M78 family)